MMESWNIGIVGSGNMEKCVVGKIPKDREIKNGILPFKTNLPLFHHSIIPLLRQKRRPQ
jgi:hypothetical protein